MTAIEKSAKIHPAAKKCCGWEEPAICVKYDIFGIFDMNVTFGRPHFWFSDMALWVPKDATGPQEYRPMSLNNFCKSLTSQKFKILTS